MCDPTTPPYSHRSSPTLLLCILPRNFQVFPHPRRCHSVSSNKDSKFLVGPGSPTAKDPPTLGERDERLIQKNGSPARVLPAIRTKNDCMIPKCRLTFRTKASSKSTPTLMDAHYLNSPMIEQSRSSLSFCLLVLLFLVSRPTHISVFLCDALC